MSRQKENAKRNFFHPEEYYRLLERRDTIRQAMLQSGGDYESEWENGILRQIEWTRQRMGFTGLEMMRLMDLKEFQDRRQGTAYRRLINRIKPKEEKAQLPAREISGPLHIENFLTFCYVFGYDVESITETTQRAKRIDDACMTVASSLFSFDLDILESIKKQILEKKKCSSYKTGQENELEAIDKIISAKKSLAGQDSAEVKEFSNDIGYGSNRAKTLDEEIFKMHNESNE